MVVWLGLISQLVVLVACVIAGWILGKRLAKLRYERLDFEREKSPPPPVNIRLHLTDGRVLPADARLSPMRTWIVDCPMEPDEVDEITVDEMPPYTEVVFGRIHRA